MKWVCTLNESTLIKQQTAFAQVLLVELIRQEVYKLKLLLCAWDV